MKLPSLHRPAPDPDGDAAGTRPTRPALGIDDWHGSWPVDDTPVPAGPEADAPLFLNPGSPTIMPS